MKCPKCNKKISSGAKFCRYCGTKIEDNKSISEAFEKSLFTVCPSCGKEMHIRKKFCTNCGEQLNGTNTTENVSASKNSNKMKIVICLLVVLLIGSAIIAAKYLITPDYDKGVEKINEDESLDIKDKDSSEENKVDENNKDQDKPDSELGVNSEEKAQIDVAEEITMQKLLTISSSSALSEYNMTHSVERVIDENITTAWVEGVTGHGIGEYILFEFDDEYSVEGFEIFAGYQKSYSLYKKNSRPKEIILEFSDGTQETYKLEDSMEKQSIDFEDKKITDFIKVIIRSVYEGNKYEDTVISEIKFYQKIEVCRDSLGKGENYEVEKYFDCREGY